jgi:hypothetical protein
MKAKAVAEALQTITKSLLLREARTTYLMAGRRDRIASGRRVETTRAACSLLALALVSVWLCALEGGREERPASS